MKIKNIKINHYGNLENKEINLDNKINIIYGKNESGKSTLLNYIKNIFYGISKNKNGKEISDYEKYKPWMKEEFSGKLKYELDNGNSFEIFRDFHKKNPKIFNENYEDILKEFNIDKKDGSQFFYDQTKIDETMFLSTVVSMQQEVRLNRQSQNILVQKLANLAGTGDDGISFKKALDKLNKRQVDQIGTERTQGKPINIVKDKMREILFVIKDIKTSGNSKTEIEEKKKKLEEKILKLEIKNNIIKKLNKLNSKINLEKEKINLINKIKNENKEKINELNIEKNKLLENKKIINSKNNSLEKEKNNDKIKKEKNTFKYFILIFIIAILFVIMKLINNQYIKNNEFNIFSHFIFSISFISILIKFVSDKNKNKKRKYEYQFQQRLEEEKIKNEMNVIDAKIESIEKQLKQVIKEQDTKENEIREVQGQLDFQIDYEIEKIKEEYQEKVEVDNILDTFDLENMQDQLKETEEELNKNKLLLHEMEIEEKNILQKLENMIVLQEEYQNLEEEQKELEEENQCINLTREYLVKAYEKMKSTITPRFTQNLSQTIAEISDHKYHQVMLNDENGLIIENQFGEYIPIDRLSVGTIDQLYLSLRLSMIDEISDETMPIILDEAFAYYDDTRLENILQFLLKKSNKHQLLIFTCTKREKQILDKLAIPYNLVELS